MPGAKMDDVPVPEFFNADLNLFHQLQSNMKDRMTRIVYHIFLEGHLFHLFNIIFFICLAFFTLTRCLINNSLAR